MRLVWVSFDVMGRDCLVAAAEAGAEVAAVVTLPGPIDATRSGQCSFDEIAFGSTPRCVNRLSNSALFSAPNVV